MSSTAVAWTIITTSVAFAALFAYVVNRLTSHRCAHPCLPGCQACAGYNVAHSYRTTTPVVNCNHECPPAEVDITLFYATLDARYASVDRVDTVEHEVHSRVTHAMLTELEDDTREAITDLAGQITRTNRRIDTTQNQSLLTLIQGLIFGAIFGATIGFILDLTLPRSAFERIAEVTLRVGSDSYVAELISYDYWKLAAGIVFGCAFAGLVLGGFIALIINMVRSRRQTTAN